MEEQPQIFWFCFQTFLYQSTFESVTDAITADALESSILPNKNACQKYLPKKRKQKNKSTIEKDFVSWKIAFIYLKEKIKIGYLGLSFFSAQNAFTVLKLLR